MANAHQILMAKGTQVYSISPEESVLEAARLMNTHHIGSLVVVSDGKPSGIFTERDVMRRVVSEQRDPAGTKVGEVMTNPVACGTPSTTYGELCAVMHNKRIRHVPIVDQEQVVGMISIGDLNRIDHDEQERTIQYLEQFISVT